MIDIEPVRTLVTADGGDIEVVSHDATSGALALRLVLEDAHCKECVMPREFLEQIALDMLGSEQVSSVAIEDPRESE